MSDKNNKDLKFGKRNATSSWSGYNHQGVVGLYVVFTILIDKITKNINDISIDSLVKEFQNHYIIYETGEDFDIIEKRNDEIVVLSRHQVKTTGDLSKKQIQEICTPNEIDESGKEVHGGRFIVQKIVKMLTDRVYFSQTQEIDEENRYLHTCYSVKKDFDNIDNKASVKLYNYDNFDYAVQEGVDCDQAIDKLLKNQLEYMKDKIDLSEIDIEYAIPIFQNALHKKIGQAHVKVDKLYPILSFSEVINCIKNTDDNKERNFKLCKKYLNTMLMDFELDEDNDNEYVIDVINKVLQLDKESLEKFMCLVSPERNIKFTDTVDNFDQLNNFRNIFCEFICNVSNSAEYVFDKKSYFKNENSYLLSAICERERWVDKLKTRIVNNNPEIINAIFQKDFMINEYINHKWNSNDKDNFMDEKIQNMIKETIVDPTIEFISSEKALKDLKGE